MFAYIKFIEDGIFASVDTKNIRRFDQSCVSYNKKYMVKWSDDDYYPAIIIYVRETKQEIEAEVQKRRVSTKPISHYASATDSEDERSEQFTKPKLHKQVVVSELKKGKIQQKTDLDILSEYKQKSSETSKDLPEHVKELADKETTEKHVKELADKEIIENLKIKIKEKDKEIAKLLEKNKEQKRIILKSSDQELQIRELTTLNISLQREVITVITELTDKFKEIDVNNLGNKNGLIEVGQVVGDEVHIGQGVMLKKKQFDSCYVLAKTASKFAKDMALAIFGAETLRLSSVTGRKGNKADKSSKPPLDPTKLQAVVDIFIFYKQKKGEAVLDLNKEYENVKAYITSKISDLNRQPRAPIGNKTKSSKTIETETEVDNMILNTKENEEEKEEEKEEQIEGEKEEAEKGDEM